MTIIGAGPSGMAAAIYLQRAGLKPLLLEKCEPGGLLHSANWVENYPGFPDGISGPDLVARFKDQLRCVGARPTLREVKSVTRARRGFEIHVDGGKLVSKAVIIATGTRPAKIAVKGGADLLGRLVFDELPQLPTSVKGKRVIVVGGGDAAFDYSISLRSKRARVVIVSRSEPRALGLLRERTEALGVELLVGATPIEIRASGNGLVVKCTAGSTRLELGGDMVLMACGRVPNIAILGPALRKAARPGRTGLPETTVKGLYLAGDVVRDKQRQTGIAVGDGIRAAMLAEQYLGGNSG